MMELIKRRMHMNRMKSRVTSQMTLDDDFNVPDSMDDVDQLILQNGEVAIESSRNQGEKAFVKGHLTFRVLYRTPGGQVMTLAGNLPFEETLNVPGLEENDGIRVSWELDDLNVGLINSRKLSVKALVTLHIQAERIEDVEVAADLRSDGTVEIRKKEIEAATLAVRKKDTFRIKEMLTVSGNRPDIEKMLWQDVKIRSISTKPLDGRIQIEGELMVFLIYTGVDSQMLLQCLEETIPFSGSVELAEADEDMIPFIPVKLVHKDLEVNPDSDGEMREIAVDAVLELDVRLYEEEDVEILGDLYALDREIIPETESLCFEQIVAKNLVKHKIQEKISLPGGQRILQICHSDGMVKIDEVQLLGNGIRIDGVLEAQMIYMTSDDSAPVAAFTELIPFQTEVGISGIREDSTYQLSPALEQISAVMLGGDTVEMKAVVSLDLLVMGQSCENVIRNVREEPIDMEKLKRMPGIVGYLVQPGDSLWKLAREYHTSVEDIMSVNQLGSSEIRPGDKLILVKAVREHM